MSTTFFSKITLLPKDPIIGLTEDFNSDKRESKINLGVGVYLDSKGNLPKLECIKTAFKSIKHSTGGYLPISGSSKYCESVKKLLFGHDNPLISDDKIVTVQSLGGTGALRVGAEMLKAISPGACVAISNPSWENHRGIFESVGFKVLNYPYYDKSKICIDIDGFVGALKKLPEQSIVVLHACCHNPTGLDPTSQEWDEIVSVIENKNHIPFLDIAYQGFSEGIEEDAFIIRKFASKIKPMFVANSFSKSLSLYGERVGALSIVTDSSDESKKVLSHLKKLIRSNYSNPPTFGQELTTEVLSNNIAKQQWGKELLTMRNRIKTVRKRLVKLLENNNAGRNFSFINNQNGMFSYSGLSNEEVNKLRTKFGIYVVNSGRICIAAINQTNVDYIASSILSVLESSSS